MTCDIAGLVLDALDEVQDRRVRHALTEAFVAESAALAAIERSFRSITAQRHDPEDLKRFFRTWNMTNNSAMCVSGIGNRMTRELRRGVGEAHHLVDAVASLHRICDEDLGVGNGVLHWELFYTMATMVCGSDDWQSKAYVTDAGTEFKRWKDRAGLVEDDLVIGLLTTLVHEIYTHAEVEFIAPLFQNLLAEHFPFTSKEQKKALTWITVHRNGTETAHFAHAQDATASYLASRAADLSRYDLVGTFREYLSKKASVMTSICVDERSAATLA